jgi:hypothetical protein
MADKKYKLNQCRMERPDGLVTVIQTCWLPKIYCNKDQKITLKSEDHKNVWTIEEVFSQEIDSDDIKNIRDEYRSVHHNDRKRK